MYNFDEIIDRTHTNALNTDGFRGYIFLSTPVPRRNSPMRMTNSSVCGWQIWSLLLLPRSATR